MPKATGIENSGATRPQSNAPTAPLQGPPHFLVNNEQTCVCVLCTQPAGEVGRVGPCCKLGRFVRRTLESLTLVHERDVKRNSKGISKKQKINALTSCPPESVCVHTCVSHTQTHTPLADPVHACAHTHAHKYPFASACPYGLIQYTRIPQIYTLWLISLWGGNTHTGTHTPM